MGLGPSKTFIFNQKLKHRMLFLMLVTASVVFVSLGETSYEWSNDLVHREARRGELQEGRVLSVGISQWLLNQHEIFSDTITALSTASSDEVQQFIGETEGMWSFLPGQHADLQPIVWHGEPINRIVLTAAVRAGLVSYEITPDSKLQEFTDSTELLWRLRSLGSHATIDEHSHLLSDPLEPLGVRLEVFRPDRPPPPSLRSLGVRYSVATVLAIGVFAGLMLLVSRLIVGPVTMLTQGVQQIAKGIYSHRIEVPSPDEIGYLTQQFNEMAQGLEERELIRNVFGRLVSQEVAEDVLSGELTLTGEEREVAILFADIRGFTTFSEAAGAGQVVAFLNEYFSAMEEVISAQGGWINRFLGDGILALFGAPNDLENPAQSAVQAAIEMQAALVDLNKRLGCSHRAGVGIHVGEVVLGCIGSHKRAEYTCIGDPVNAASRIEGLTKTYQVPHLISKETSERLPKDLFESVLVDRVKLKGKQELMECYYAVRRDENLLTDSDRTALREFQSSYVNGDFEQALHRLTQLSVELPFVDVLRHRCETYRKTPPSDWNGVFVQG